MLSTIFLIIIFEFPFVKTMNENLIHRSDQLIMVHTLWTNGERTPFSTYPLDVYRSYPWHPGYGEITPQGMSQQYHLGNRLRKRYVHYLKLLDTRYRSDEIYIQSLDLNRTIVSAHANLLGMYGGSGKPNIDYPSTHGWPNIYIPIPVHSLSLEKYPQFYHQCKRRDQLISIMTETPEYHAFLISNKKIFGNLSKETGMVANFQTVTKLANTLKIQKKNGLTLSQWISRNIQNIENLANTVYGFHNGIGIFPYKGIDFTIELPKIQGGHLLWEIIERMREKVACINFPDNTEKCKWLKKLKYFAYSMDEISISNLFSTLGFNKLDVYSNSLPEPSTSISIELWLKKNNSTYIKIIYLKPNRPTVDISRMVYGCKFECTLEQFARRSARFKPLPNITELCNTHVVKKEFLTPKKIHHSSELPQWLLVLGTLNDVRPIIFGVVLFFSFAIVIACHNGRPCTTAPKPKRTIDLF